MADSRTYRYNLANVSIQISAYVILSSNDRCNKWRHSVTKAV